VVAFPDKFSEASISASTTWRNPLRSYQFYRRGSGLTASDHNGGRLPLKIVITYEKLSTELESAGLFSDWRFDQVSRRMFAAKIPNGAIKADFVASKREVQK
jgi:Predicted periplasmic protein (DUF2092)